MKIYINFFAALTFCLLEAEHVADGIEYTCIRQSDPNLCTHLVKVDPSKASVIIEEALGKCASSAKVTEMSAHNNAIVAINGGFFDFGQKNKLRDLFVKFMDTLGYNTSYTFPVFTLKIKNEWFSISDRT